MSWIPLLALGSYLPIRCRGFLHAARLADHLGEIEQQDEPLLRLRDGLHESVRLPRDHLGRRLEVLGRGAQELPRAVDEQTYGAIALLRHHYTRRDNERSRQEVDGGAGAAQKH